MTGTELLAGLTLAGIKVDELANFSQVDPSTIKDMVARGSQAVRAEGGTVRKVIDALKVKGGVEIIPILRLSDRLLPSRVARWT
jgi:hypothetical protein